MHDFSNLGAFSKRALSHTNQRGPSSLHDNEDLGPASWREVLSKVIESEIVPRLLLSCRASLVDSRPKPDLPAAAGEFVRMALSADPAAAFAFVAGLMDRGVSPDVVLLDFLAPAARQLGALWESDHCDFIDVTTALRRLQLLMDELTVDWDPPTPAAAGPRILLSPAPGETHVFGLAMVENFFRAAGWRTRRCLDEDYLAALAEEPFAIIGFSVSCRRYVNDLRLAVQKAREASKNPSILVLVGGALVNEDADLAQAVGADGAAIDAPRAVSMARDLLERTAVL